MSLHVAPVRLRPTVVLLSLATEPWPSLASSTAATTPLQATSSSTWSESVGHTDTHTHTDKSHIYKPINRYLIYAVYI